MRTHKILACLLALVLSLSLLASPVLASPPQNWSLTADSSPTEANIEVPEGYNENDFQKLSNFMETEDSNGIKNGVKMQTYNVPYNPTDPTTWGGGSDIAGWVLTPDGKRLTYLRIQYRNTVGDLDLSGCAFLSEVNCDENQLDHLILSDNELLTTINCSNCGLLEISLDGCLALKNLRCRQNKFSSLDVSACTKIEEIDCGENQIQSLTLPKANTLTRIFCDNNRITSLDASGLSNLAVLHCAYNEIKTLNLSGATSLSFLSCTNNQLEELDLSSCTALTELNCTNNRLSALDVSNLGMLGKLTCNKNRLKELSVNTGLYSLDCSDNPLSKFDPSMLTNLGTLNCNRIGASQLDVRSLANLCVLKCSGNQLSKLDLSSSNRLLELDCSSNKIDSLNFSNVPQIQKLILSDNELREIDISNCKNIYQLDIQNTKISELELSHNTGLRYLSTETLFSKLDLNATEIPVQNITAIGNGKVGITSRNDPSTWSYICIVTAAPEVGEEFLGWYADKSCTEKISDEPSVNIDNSYTQYYAKFSTKGGTPGPDLPDVPKGYNVNDYTKLYNFLEISDQDGVKNGSKLSENYNPTEPATWGTGDIIRWKEINGEQQLYKIEIVNLGLVGELDLSNCAALESLDCSQNQLTSLNVAGASKLLTLICSDNQLSSLTLEGNNTLSMLMCQNNQIEALNLSAAPAVWDLYAFGNRLTSADFTQCTSLRICYLSSNQLRAVDVTKNSGLTTLDVRFNKLEELDVSNNVNLANLYCSHNKIKTLNLSNNAQLGYLYCGDNELTSLDVSHMRNLMALTCENNHIAELKLNNYLSQLDVSNNPLNAINVSSLPSLSILGCKNTGLTELDVSSNTYLTKLDCSNNSLTTLDVSKNTALATLTCSGNQLTALDVTNNMYLNDLDCSDNAGIQNIDVTKNTMLWALDVVNTGIAELDLSQNAQFCTLSTSPIFRKLDLSACPDFPADWIVAMGNGQFGVTSISSDDLYPGTFNNGLQISVTAEPREGETFEGWYEDAGFTKAISTDKTIYIQTVNETGTTTTRENKAYYAKFSGAPSCSHENTELRNVKEATCTEDGYTGDEVCTVCGEIVKQGETIPATSHKTELRNAKEATCTEDGYTGDEVCTVCGETVKKGEVIPAYCPSKAFVDLNTAQWYHEYTDYVINHALMKGMDKTHFAPEGNLTRGQLVTTLYRLAEEPEVTEPTTFTDVAEGRYYTDAVAWAEDLGIAKGMTDTTFAPEGTVTRQQAATFLYRYVTLYLRQEPVEGVDLKDFRDGSSVMNYAKTAMCWAVAEGFFEGYGDGTLRPAATLTRTQMAKLLTILDQKF